ncbi:pilus assembly protein TadG-related protein [Pseudarthrobacter sp. SSS035]|uniref:pilus assembly protein TadG-related protein n=1 Tax=Pseudarthrobacter sp. SSS035 TaxID=2931399 RepID=UPI002112C839|nr:Tad domain-containing protein [Pseudarthrobacter sp. SSS035]
MRRLTRRSRSSSSKVQESQKGAASIMVAVLVVALLGCAALAVDVGAMYSEKAQLQNGADFSALAVAQDCANGDCGDFMATGNELANGNANDSSSGIAAITFPDANTVRVETNAREAGSGDDHFSLFFARVMGIDTAEITAAAEASWGPPSIGSTLPWTVSECVFRKQLSASQIAELDSTGDFTGDPSATHILLRYDTNAPTVPGCAAQNGYRPGGFGWLNVSHGCSADIDLNSDVNGQPGNHFPTEHECDAVLATIMDRPALIPLFDSNSGNGNNTVYSLIGFAAFQVTGYKFGGPSVTHVDPAAPSCTGNCRGLQGFFARFVSLGEYSLSQGGGPNYGGTVVALTE